MENSTNNPSNNGSSAGSSSSSSSPNAVGTGILDALKGKAPVVLQTKNNLANVVSTHAPVASALIRPHFGESSVSRSRPRSSTLPCVLASSKQVPTTSFAVAVCRKHGLAASLDLEEIEYSEDYTRIMFRSPKSQVVHRYHECVLEFHDQNERGTSTLRREGHVSLLNHQALKDGYLVYIEDKCKTCKKSLRGKDCFMHRDSRFCSTKCRSDDCMLNFEQYMMLDGPWPYIRRRRSIKNKPVKFFIGD